MGRNTSGVKGISLIKDDHVVGMVVANPEATLLTACEHGYGKRTYFGYAAADVVEDADETDAGADAAPAEAEGPEAEVAGALAPATPRFSADAGTKVPTTEAQGPEAEGPEEEETSGTMRYRRQRRGGKGLRDIKTTARNGRVIGIVRVTDDDEILMMTARGKLQRIAARDINPIGRNTQGVRIMSLDEEDTLMAVVRVPKEEEEGEEEAE